MVRPNYRSKQIYRDKILFCLLPDFRQAFLSGFLMPDVRNWNRQLCGDNRVTAQQLTRDRILRLKITFKLSYIVQGGEISDECFQSCLIKIQRSFQ